MAEGKGSEDGSGTPKQKGSREPALSEVEGSAAPT